MGASMMQTSATLMQTNERGDTRPQTSAFLIRDNGFLLKAGWLALRHLVWQCNWDYSRENSCFCTDQHIECAATGTSYSLVISSRRGKVYLVGTCPIERSKFNGIENAWVYETHAPGPLGNRACMQTFTFSYDTDSKNVREKWIVGRAPDEIAFVPWCYLTTSGEAYLPLPKHHSLTFIKTCINFWFCLETAVSSDTETTLDCCK